MWRRMVVCENKHCTLEECSIPYGFCHCGCGTKTAIAPQNDKYMGRIKGEPYRYIIRHGTRLSGVDFIVDEKTGCWEWQLGKDKDGYGMVTVRGKQLRAHRFYYEQK